jgi:hypothetical protein
MGGSLAKIQKFIYGWAERNGYTNRRVTHTPTDPGAELEGGIIMTDFLQRFQSGSYGGMLYFLLLGKSGESVKIMLFSITHG